MFSVYLSVHRLVGGRAVKHTAGGGDKVHSQSSSHPLRTINVRELVMWRWCTDVLAAERHNKTYGEHHCSGRIKSTANEYFHSLFS